MRAMKRSRKESHSKNVSFPYLINLSLYLFFHHILSPHGLTVLAVAMVDKISQFQV